MALFRLNACSISFGIAAFILVNSWLGFPPGHEEKALEG